jgi:malonate decarboxylase delta subunit
VEKLHFEFTGQHTPDQFDPVLVGVVGSGNLEVMIEPATGNTCRLDITTSARGLAGVAVSINDMGATPAVVSLRLDQATAGLPLKPKPKSGTPT